MQQLGRIIGENLRRLRSDSGLSLDALAKASGVSKSRLGQIERGESNPSISTVWQIAHALKVEFSALVTSPQEDSQIVSRADIEPVTTDDGRCRTYALFAFDSASGFEVYTSEIEPGGQLYAEPHPAGTRETITLMAGRLSIIVSGTERNLGAGDAFRFKADEPHEYRNVGDELAVFSMIVAYPRKG